MGKHYCNVVRVEAGEASQFQVLVDQKTGFNNKCKYDLAFKLSPEKNLCYCYGFNGDIYKCKHHAEGRLRNLAQTGEWTGPAIVQCTFK